MSFFIVHVNCLIVDIKNQLSLASESITIGENLQIDLPMRPFSVCVDTNLMQMCEYLGVRYRVEPLQYIFSRLSGETNS